jgi:hypothetical protein
MISNVPEPLFLLRFPALTRWANVCRASGAWEERREYRVGVECRLESLWEELSSKDCGSCNRGY